MPRSKPMPSQEELQKLLTYDRKTGFLFWKKRPQEMFSARKYWLIWNTRFSGKRAFNVQHHNGYLYGCILGWHYLTHRLVWQLVHGKLPDEIDHINGIRTDNRLVNLRSVTRKENCKNQGRDKRNTSGVTGVCWDFRNAKWLVRIGHKHFGRFESFQDAVAARKAAELKHNFHKNHGRPAVN